ncbi:hypothetical protein WDW86_05250 [Bdellovibrionota bacterium FG-2]
MTTDLWLVRTFKNQILGPFEKGDLVRMIEQGALDIQDEVCPTLGYWVGLHERAEIHKLLGVELPKKRPFVPEGAEADEEITESDLTVSALAERAFERDPKMDETAVQWAKPVPGMPSFLGKVEQASLFRVATVLLLGVILWSLYKVFLMLTN